jgi:type VI secretion system protein ImpL
VPEIETALKTQWNRTWDKLAPLFGKYPFRRDSGRDASPEEFDALRFGSAFWGAFRSYEAPFCMQRGNSWYARVPLPRRVNLPPGMLGRVNLVARLARIFWDKEGKRIPLDLTVTALPLPKEVGYDGYVTMSFLRAGGASVFGFNQKPIPKSFQPQWWSTEGASMGITFGDNEYHATPDRTLDVPESTWSLYRLMEKARAIDDKLVWVLPADGPKHKAVAIRFIIRGDVAALRPWTVVGDERPARGAVSDRDIVRRDTSLRDSARSSARDLTNRASDAISDRASNVADDLRGR